MSVSSFTRFYLIFSLVVSEQLNAESTRGVGAYNSRASLMYPEFFAPLNDVMYNNVGLPYFTLLCWTKYP